MNEQQQFTDFALFIGWERVWNSFFYTTKENEIGEHSEYNGGPENESINFITYFKSKYEEK